MKNFEKFEKQAEKIANLMIQKIESIEGNWKKPWVSVKGRNKFIPENINGREYTGSNKLLLSFVCEISGYKAPIFLTFKQAQEQKLSIKKGASSFPISYYNLYAINKNTNYKICIEEYKDLTEEEQKEYIVKSILQFFNVFNIEQTNIDEKDPERWQNILDKYQDDEEFIANEQKGIEIESIENMILSQSWYCPINIKVSDSAFYVPYFNYIEVPLKKQFESNEAFYCTLLHEMAHSTGHKNLLNRLEISKHSKQNYAIEELTAEMTASFTALELGVSNTLREENAKYLKSWCNALKAEPTIILTILADVIKASKLILERLEENNSKTKKIA